MHKGKLKLPVPEKALRVFPDRLGSLVAGFDVREEDNGGSGVVFESGEELDTFQPNGFRSDRESDNDEKFHQEIDVKVRPRPDKDAAGPIPAFQVIAADKKRSDLEYELSQLEINLEKLQRIANTGLPDGEGLRATAWKLLLGFLRPPRNLWEKELTENRQKYAKLKEELLPSPSKLTRRKDEGFSSDEQHVDSDVDRPLQRHEISQENHRLSLHTEIVQQIDRGLQRTHPDMKFFSGYSSFSRKNKKAMRNILLLFAKRNPAIRYVQGMNEVLAPIYCVFSTDTDEQNAVKNFLQAYAEADCFSCFVRLLSDSVDHFCQQLDNSSVGILSTLSLSELLKASDEELWWHLEFTSKVRPQFYAFRWITLLLSQEFNFQVILRIWDTLLGNPFGVQHYPDVNIEYHLQVAQDLSPDTSLRLSPKFISYELLHTNVALDMIL